MKNDHSKADSKFPSFKFLLAGALLALFAGASVSCGTVRGMGQDIQRAGNEIQKAAN